MKAIIIGGVAAGASAAARLRRLDEHARIILLERGRFISYANCGLPYHLGGVIPDRDDLLVMEPEKFQSWFNIEVRTENEAVRIDRANKKLDIRRASGEIYQESYDKLLIATGAVPAGAVTQKRVFHLWTLADMDKVAARLNSAKRAVIVGAGFIGLEAAENLKGRGLDVTVIQRSNHVLPTLDAEMAQPLADELIRSGIKLRFGCQVKDYTEKEDSVTVHLDCGVDLETDAVIVSTGVQPNSKLAQECGLECGKRGHIIVNERMQTSDPDIFAAGDVVEVTDPVFGGRTAIPLAGPANKQGRIAADAMAGRSSAYQGSFGTSVVKVGHLTAAGVGLTEKRLKDMGKTYRKLYLHPNSNASYYPGGSRMTLKLIFGDDGAIYGAQIVGVKGVDKRIDTIAQAMRNHLTAPQLGALELAYAPPYSSAKDPVNFAGFVAENILNGLTDVVYPDTIPADAVILDVREPEENALGSIPGAVNCPLGKLRSRLAELDKGKFYVTCCQVGLRGYLAERILKQNGFKAANLSGGYLGWKLFHPDPVEPPQPSAAPEVKTVPAAGMTRLDVRTLQCPGPVLKLKKAIAEAKSGDGVHLLAASTFERDLLNWAKGGGHQVVNLTRRDGYLEADVLKGQDGSLSQTPVQNAGHAVAMVVFSNDFDRAMAAMILANGFAAAGAKVTVFFTFWGLSVLRKNPAPHVRKDLISRMFGWMLPNGAMKLALSKMNMMGMGGAMMKSVMKRKGVLSLPELIRSAREAGVKFIACDMAMDIMGITREELIEVDEIAGVATFAEIAKNCSNTLFI
ncbi:MAG: hypothetical protein E7055_10860 [Lentisphaerae bacterium]|nr:hypothetical protein [Lentisphaerota bacterium]